MCRSIIKLREGTDVFDRQAMEEAALQYVRKVSGFRQPSTANRAAFQQAVDRIADVTEALMRSLEIRG